jgi:uncharacterized membrane protein YkoI
MQSKAAAAKPRVSMEVARARALAQVRGGTVESGKLVNQRGRLVYDFAVQMPNNRGIQNVWVSAENGKIIGRKHQSAMKKGSDQRAEATPHKSK